VLFHAAKSLQTYGTSKHTYKHAEGIDYLIHMKFGQYTAKRCRKHTFAIHRCLLDCSTDVQTNPVAVHNTKDNKN